MTDAMPKGATITEMDAGDLVGRLVLNPNGVEFVVTHLSFNARDGVVWIGIAEVEGAPGMPGPSDAEAELPNLDGWTIHQKLLPKDFR